MVTCYVIDVISSIRIKSLTRDHLQKAEAEQGKMIATKYRLTWSRLYRETWFMETCFQ